MGPTGAKFCLWLVVLLPSCLGERLYGSDSAIHSIVEDSLRQWKVLQLAERIGIYHGNIQRADSVCYEDIGCFQSNGTFKHLKQLPDHPDAIGTKLLLYTAENRYEPQHLDYKEKRTIIESNLDENRPTIIVSHGFGGRGSLPWLISMKDAFLSKENVNFIAVDWSAGAKAPNYINAVVNTEVVGRQIALTIIALKEVLGIHEKNVHMIGFSLGAQVAGFVGKSFKSVTGKNLGRITGLDPAGPLFDDRGGEVHLYKDDADFVDVIHTNADLLIYGGMGMTADIGDVDYYPNGGKRQPGCESTIIGAVTDIFTKDRKRACNHERAVHLFTESILKPNGCDFLSYQCNDYAEFGKGECLDCNNADNCGRMGYHSIGTGTHYLMTSKEEPYCGENIAIKVDYAKDQAKSFGQISLALTSKNTEIVNVTLTKKDEKLLPGDGAKIATVLPHNLPLIKEIRLKYIKFNGWFLKGTDSFTIDKVSLFNRFGNLQLRVCSVGKDPLESGEVISFPAKNMTCS